MILVLLLIMNVVIMYEHETHLLMVCLCNTTLSSLCNVNVIIVNETDANLILAIPNMHWILYFDNKMY
jgi:hypothetical protein